MGTKKDKNERQKKGSGKMAIEVKIKKKLGDFVLDTEWKSSSRRLGILGSSGCGKSMTLKCIAGIEMPDRGRIAADGHTLYNGSVNLEPQKRRIGYLFQNYALFPNMCVRKNVMAGIKGIRKERERTAERMIDRFCLRGLENLLPGELSGGQQQRTALARIMASEPEVILLDEPFSALDEFLKDKLQQEMMGMLKDYEGTVILVSHSRDEIYRFSEELIVMDAGKTVCQGKTREIFAKPEWKEAAKLTGCKNIVAAEREDAHRLRIPGWGITLILRREIPEAVCWAGIRAHDFVPVWAKEGWMPEKASGENEAGEKAAAGENQETRNRRIPVTISSISELPFERKYFLKSPAEGEDICWFVQRETLGILERKGLPDYLEIPEGKLLLLK